MKKKSQNKDFTRDINELQRRVEQSDSSLSGVWGLATLALIFAIAVGIWFCCYDPALPKVRVVFDDLTLARMCQFDYQVRQCEAAQDEECRKIQDANQKAEAAYEAKLRRVPAEFRQYIPGPSLALCAAGCNEEFIQCRDRYASLFHLEVAR